jgi:hypothetical protein
LVAGANPAELYDPEAGAFIVTGTMTAPEYKYGMYWHTATLLPSGKVLVAGGSDEFSMFSSAQLYDPAVGAFAARGDMSARRALHTATLLPDGTVLIAGGKPGSLQELPVGLEEVWPALSFTILPLELFSP